ncbi:hypothetical protein MJO29_006036 [Puccinia striiformis f. sp. tritici]|uniref:Secreted protein n=1 Tax=Puccinia striiformis f. sp. tritici PST-78 TaxID=1165861 RepID=A0A0L0V109_9BASI|nr:hypothetical protein Pst134EA_011247 [Puccinia striiformis f. sp. tritici]KAH9467608.1 hypothetical protein Pst134EA_011247 [Puccinia striiformis f. sp. tritici]KAI7957819.1 hypothetical protein MJO29_006036 [Puccinia striiformis f. sp. tritici]KAI9608216.1 hypothetical protein KEM48_003349 [Puccinia striiformis f. sp. tritici PST-130]KNE92714.1 hypothetical protein PSTG_13922 [Puccinia striiformis f. sp. tritici PST-78]
MQSVKPTIVLVALLAGAISFVSVEGSKVFPCLHDHPSGFCGVKKDDKFLLWPAFPEGKGFTCGKAGGIAYCSNTKDGFEDSDPDRYDKWIGDHCKQA